jgi:hypothetical protein
MICCYLNNFFPPVIVKVGQILLEEGHICCLTEADNIFRGESTSIYAVLYPTYYCRVDVHLAIGTYENEQYIEL